MKSMFVDCKTCGVKFDWPISQEDPQCTRCQVIYGNDAKAILAIMGEHKVPGQRELIHVLGLMMTRMDVLTAKLTALEEKVESKDRGMTIR